LDLERLDLMADGALGDAKLLGGTREALVPRGSIDDRSAFSGGSERRMIPRSYMNQIGSSPRNDALPVRRASSIYRAP
jgi:hypothetical protein